MKLMVIKAMENRTERDVILNPAQIESIEAAADGMSRITTASGRAIYSELELPRLFNMWTMALNPDMEAGYNAGVADARAAYERAAQLKVQEAEEEKNGRE